MPLQGMGIKLKLLIINFLKPKIPEFAIARSGDKIDSFWKMDT